MAELLSLSFYLVFVASICIAAYILYSNPRNYIVRLAFFVALATALRNFGYGMRSVATSFNEAYFWTYFAAIGWTAFYCLTFAWFYRYLFNKYSKVVNVLVGVFYALIVWEFVLSPTSIEHYNLIVSRYGIVDNNYFYGNSASLNDLALVIVYMTVVILIVASIGIQFFKSRDEARKKKLGVLVSGVLLSVMTSMIGDQLGQLLSSDPLPSISPICSLFTLLGIVIVLVKEKQVRNLGSVLVAYRDISDIEKRIWERIEIYIGVFGLALFGLNRIFFYTNYNREEYILLAVALLISFLMRMSRTLIQSKVLVRVLMVLFLATEIAVVLLVGYRTSLISLWFFPFCFFPLLVLFENKRGIYIISALSVAFGLATIFNLGGYWSGFNLQNVLQRLILSVIFLIQLVYANVFYRKRNAYNQRLIEIQEKYSEITAFYIDINIDNFAHKTEEMLRLCREFIKADRVFMFTFDYARDCISNHVESLGDRISSTRNFMRNIRLSELQWFMERLREDGILSLSDIRNLPKEAKGETLFFSWSGIKSIYCAPIFSGSNIIGVVGQERVRGNSRLPKEEEDFVIFAANTQAEAFSKIESQKKINYMAYYNTLTDLPNRLEFEKRIQQYLDLHPEASCALAFLDVDSFQEINDIVGHDGGDELLVLLAKEIAKRIGNDDILAHYSGDEFAILIKNVNTKHDVGQRVNEILSAVRVPKKILNREFFVSASVGVSIYMEDAFSIAEMMENSELAQYSAKRTGKNRYVICDEYMKIEHAHRIDLKKSLAGALERGELALEYQPILSSDNMDICGFEALIRWDTMNYGRLYPNEFLQLADEVGVTVPMIGFVIDQCCRHIKSWADRGIRTQLTINLSSENINHIDLYRIFREHIDVYGIDPGCLTAEFSEKYGNEIDNEMLKKLKELGIRISIDEFGSKNSSLSRIVKLCIDEIKIDIGFVQRIGVSPKDDGIAQSIITMGKELGLNVTALGVENYEQYEFFKNNRCDRVQGYFFYKPMSSADATDLLQFFEEKRAKKMEEMEEISA